MSEQIHGSPDVTDAGDGASSHVAPAAVRQADTASSAWADPPGAHGHHQAAPMEFAQNPHTHGRWRIVVLAVASACTIVAAVIGARIVQRSESDGWTTAGARDMSISLPRSFVVTTDPDDYAELLAGVGTSDSDQLAALIEQFPDFFALAAIEQPGSDEFGASVEVLRVPTAGESLDEVADVMGEDLEAGGAFQVTDESERVVGTGRYAAARIAFEGSSPGQPPGRAVLYLVDGGSYVWMVTFSAPSEDYDSLSRTFDRSIATLTLPPRADDDEEDGDGQR